MADINVVVSKEEGVFRTEISFNLIKCSVTSPPVRVFDEFLGALQGAVDSTFEMVSAPSGKSSAGIMKFAPRTLEFSYKGLTDEEKRECEAIRSATLRKWKNPAGL